MYLTHYNLKIMPFEANPDPRFMWFSEKHKEALDSFKYGIKRNIGFLLLTGDIGTGKSTLINCFLNENDSNAITASIPDPDLGIDDFFLMLSNKFHINPDFKSKGEFLINFEKFLKDTYSRGLKTILIIDEAQKLNQQLLEQIRLLSNIEKQDSKLLNVFLVGQTEFHELIRDEHNKALRQRIAVHYNIDPLTEHETHDYIKHRLKISGTEEEIFSSNAIYEIYSFSKGYPRLINTICDRAMLTGYVSDKKTIDDKIVKKCGDELRIPDKRDDAYKIDLQGLEVDANEKNGLQLKHWKVLPIVSSILTILVAMVILLHYLKLIPVN